MTDELNSEEFDCPPGKITVDVTDEINDHNGRGIHIYFFDPTVSDTDGLADAMLPNKNQWNHVKEQVFAWLDETLK